MKSISVICLIVVSVAAQICAKEAENDVLVYTVATEETDGFQRYLSSANDYKIAPKILGFGKQWQGGENIKEKPGGGWKINLLKEALQPYESEQDKIVIFTDGYDVIFLSGLEAIVEKFKATGARILFGAESFCWPDPTLVERYPVVEDGKRFLNSGMYMGYVPEVLKLLQKETIENTDDDQLYFTNAYLDAEFGKLVHMQLDHKSDIFQNINGAAHELEILLNENKESGIEEYQVKNVISHTTPLMLHGNGPAKMNLNYLSNYVPRSWNSVEGCTKCNENLIEMSQEPEKAPIVLMALFVEANTPFLEEQLELVYKLEYPKQRIHLFIHNAVKFHSDDVNNFVKKHGDEYLSTKEIHPEDGTTEYDARDLSLEQCVAKDCDYYFSVDSVAHLENPHTLRLLIEQNRSVVAPMLTRPGKAWSNFWGALTKDGFYSRSNDYMDIVHNEKRGLWNVPFITNCYLVNATLLRRFDTTKLNYNRPRLDADMAFCSTLRDLDVFMYVSNRFDFGYLITPDTYDVTRAEPEMYQVFENEKNWIQRYIHKDYARNFEAGHKNEQPCPDVYRFPIVTERFTQSLINMMENFGKWSTGKNEDDRLEGGYEAVPTRDIHMNQVGWERHWLHFLQRFVRPLQEHVFTGYFHDPPKSLMNFVVRYRPDEQPSLRPHHDSSTYTINLALNQFGRDYEGGGCKFIRYNCSVTDTAPGWMLMHPGRLTHYHEGLLVTKGTRYIMISFVDP